MNTRACVAHIQGYDPKLLVYLDEVQLDLTGNWKRRAKVKGPDGVLRVFENEDEELTVVVQTDPTDSSVTGTWFMFSDEMDCELDKETLKDPAAPWKPPTQASDFYFAPYRDEGQTNVLVTRKSYFDIEGYLYDQHEPLVDRLLADHNLVCAMEAVFEDDHNRPVADVTDLLTNMGFTHNPAILAIGDNA